MAGPSRFLFWSDRMAQDIILEESPRPDDEDAYFRRYWNQSIGHKIAGWWQKVPGSPSMGELADRINQELTPANLVKTLLKLAGEDPERPGLLETPARFLKAWEFYTSGYRMNPAKVFKVFDDGAAGVDEMIVLGPLRVYSLCEHHLAPFFGKAWIGYVPNGKIIGLSKMSRVLRVFTRRLQVQERLTGQVADCLTEHLQPLGVGVILQCRHLCMECRGVEEIGAVTTTSAMRGVLKEKPEARAEFLSFAHK